MKESAGHHCHWEEKKEFCSFFSVSCTLHTHRHKQVKLVYVLLPLVVVSLVLISVHIHSLTLLAWASPLVSSSPSLAVCGCARRRSNRNFPLPVRSGLIVPSHGHYYRIIDERMSVSLLPSVCFINKSHVACTRSSFPSTPRNSYIKFASHDSVVHFHHLNGGSYSSHWFHWWITIDSSFLVTGAHSPLHCSSVCIWLSCEVAQVFRQSLEHTHTLGPRKVIKSHRQSK